MNQYFRLLLIAYGLLCSNIVLGAQAERPPLMTERFYLSQADQNPYGDNGDRSWNKVLLDMGIPGYQPREGSGYSECNYFNALTALRELKYAHLAQSYLVLWVRNQVKVFAACDGSSTNDDQPALPRRTMLPKRARSDYLYQLGSWHFYRHEYAEALDAYKQVEKIRKAPMRPKAAYMVIRSLAYLDEGDAAYDQILKVLSDPSLREVHSIAGNYRFVIMSNSRYSEIPHVTTELAKRHLKWLLEVIKIDPEKATTNPAQAKADYNDALSQLNVYFPIYRHDSKEVDWWLDDNEEALPRMQAVKDFAGNIEMVDWLQAMWAYNVFDDDWLWSLHSAQNPYWSQNEHVVAHEVERWKKSGNGGWLQLAISRVHPSDPLASVLMLKAEAYLDRPWKSETLEYREWLFDLWRHSVRLSLGQGKIDKALALIVDHPDMARLLDNTRYNYQYVRKFYNSYSSTLEETLRWLVYNNQIESARTFLNAIQKIVGAQSFTEWRTLLATNTEETMASALRATWWSESPATSRLLWQEMLNTVSSQFLERLAADDRIPQSDRSLISRSLFTRAVMLKAGPAGIDHAAAVAAKHNPALREDILQATSGHNEAKYIEFLLKHPRFRPATFLEYAPNREQPKAEENIDAIDTYNHNDNNWWCRFDRDRFSDRAFNAMKITPKGSSVLSESKINEEFEPHLQYQKALLEQHPYQSLIDDVEVKALEAIPAGPEYLSAYINRWERATPTAKSDDERNRRAANLHRAVRTTRYGCNRDGSHAAYSRESFKLLHSRYDDTPWAKATPYWFE